jgi:cysteine desulfurase/selenocysteine lyase
MYGPTGIGVLYGKAELLEGMTPWQGGGDMIRTVQFDHTTWNEPPWKFEAGTPDVAGAIGLGAAIEYLQRLGLERIANHERDLLAHATECLDAVSLLRWVGRPRVRAGILSFVIEGVHAHDVGTILDREGIAIRTGHHCAQPLMSRYGIAATARISLGLYNTREEVEAAARALEKAKRMLS